jgi:hypothetical protein
MPEDGIIALITNTKRIIKKKTKIIQNQLESKITFCRCRTT